MKLLSKWIGQQKEQQASDWLQQQQLQILARNFRCDRYRKGEIDLIALDRDKVLVFFEIKYRKDTEYGHPLEFIHAAQQQRIRRCAEVFLLKHPEYQDCDCRFDVVFFCGQNPAEWLQNAF
ncbi:MAG: YraN family protein [Thiotrichales bacterium]|nr:YraN family protein [Thiotrichales bacterium]